MYSSTCRVRYCRVRHGMLPRAAHPTEMPASIQPTYAYMYLNIESWLQRLLPPWSSPDSNINSQFISISRLKTLPFIQEPDDIVLFDKVFAVTSTPPQTQRSPIEARPSKTEPRHRAQACCGSNTRTSHSSYTRRTQQNYSRSDIRPFTIIAEDPGS